MPKQKPFDEKTLKMLEETVKRRAKHDEQLAKGEKALREIEEKLDNFSDAEFRGLVQMHLISARNASALSRRVSDLELLVYTMSLRMATEFGWETPDPSEEDSP